MTATPGSRIAVRPATALPVLVVLLLTLWSPNPAHSYAQAYIHEGPGPNLPPQFELVQKQGNYTLPVGMAFAPDESFFVIQKGGVVWYHDGTTKQTTPFINLEDEVNLQGDRGLLGIALHQGFVPDGGPSSWVYLLYTVSPVFGQNWGYNEDDRYSFSRLTRYKAMDLGGLIVADLPTRQVLLGNQLPDGTVPDGIASLHSSHSNGSVHMAADGSLILSVGEGAHFDLLDTGGFDPAGFDDFVHPVTGLRGPTPLDQDSGSFRSQDLRSLAGKVLRIDPETGLGYPSNPFYDGDPASNASKAWCIGLRSPFRANIKPGTGSLDPADGNPGVIFIGDVGGSVWEELNVSYGGENFGWPCYEGPGQHAGYQAYDSGSTPFNYPDCQTNNPGIPTLPSIAWHHTLPGQVTPAGIHFDNEGNQAFGFTGTCAVGGVHYAGGSYPASYDGLYFFGDFTNEFIKTLSTDAQDVPLEIRDFGSGFEKLVDIERNPVTGDLYLTLIEGGTGHVYRLRYDPDTTPVAVATASPLFGDAPLTVNFDGSASDDVDNDPLTFDWDFGDGTPNSSLESPQHVYTSDGVYTAVLTVSDPAGHSTTDEVEVTVGNSPPTAQILTPTQGQLFTAPSTVQLSGTGNDVEDTNLTYEWSIDLVHNFHTHPVFFTTSGAQAQFSVEPHGFPEDMIYFVVNLTVRDTENATGTDQVYIYPQENLRDLTGTALPISRMDELFPPVPQGAGNVDIEVIRDTDEPPVLSADPRRQFDTFHDTDQGDDDWIGFEVTEPLGPEARFVSLQFQEGMHFPNGGWFEDFRVEVRDQGVWVEVDNLHVDPPYPFELAAMPSFDGESYETYSLTFDPAQGDAVRLRGTPGGLDGFISVAELRLGVISVLPVEPWEDITDQADIIAGVFDLVPPGSMGMGHPDPEVIRNGTFPPAASTSVLGQYATFHNGDQNGFDWIGYRFDEVHTFARLVFQEGLHTPDGGRFDPIAVEARDQDTDTWVVVQNMQVTPVYPGSPDHAVGYETFVIDFDPVDGRSIRVAGRLESDIGYISVGELRVLEPTDPTGCPATPDVSNFCTVSPNSAGAGATIEYEGCTSVAFNDFTLGIHEGVPFATGIFYYGDATISQPLGDGFRCVAGTTRRLEPSYQMDGSGHAHVDLDLSSAPTPETMILPGSTWHFQAWYRDPSGPGGSGFNLSDGLTVTFAP